MPTSKAITASKFFGKDRYEYYLNELLTEKTLGGQQLSKQELKEAFSKRSNKISFENFVDKLISTKTAKAAVSGEDSPVADSSGLVSKGGALVKSPRGALQKSIEGISKDPSFGGGIAEDILAIKKSVISIAEILANQQKQKENAAAFERRRAEQEKRGLEESRLEKTFKGIAKTAENIIAPVKSLLDRILNFIGTIILGRIVFKIIEWFGDKNNADKVKSLIRFFSDWGPTLLSLYIVFGTSFGKFARGLISLVIRSTIRLGAAVAGLAVKAGIGKAGGKLSKVAGFLGGPRGKLLGTALQLGATVAGTMAISNAIKGDNGKKEPEQPTQKFSGGGLAVPRFSGGGFNFKGMFSGAGMGAMFGSLGMLLGGAMGGSSGFVSGPGGPKDDKVPAMLSDGEFVMSAGAVQKYGVDTLEAMNAAGGGTNRPKIMGSTTYAAGGGYIGSKIDKKEYIKDPILEKRDRTIKLQLQAQKALSMGKGVNIRGAKLGGAQLGTGYSVKYQGKNSILIKDGAKNFSTGIGDKEISLGGIRYFAMKRGGDVIYVPQDSRDRNSGGGMFQPGGLFGGPRMSARMDYASSKGKYYSSSDKKTYANYNDALAARKSRMTSLVSQQRLNKLSFAGANRSSRGVRFDAENKARSSEFKSRGGLMGQLGRFGQRMFGGAEAQRRLEMQQKASDSRVKQAGAESIGRYYSSSDGKYYKDYATAKKAKDLRLAQQQKKSAPTIKPPLKPKPKYTPAGGGQGGRRGSGSSPSTNTPTFSATSSASNSAKLKTLGVVGR
jgi:hypothetical protein